MTVGALRNARRAGVGLADQARLADQALYAPYGGKAYASTLLLHFDLSTGVVRAVDPGSSRLYRLRGNSLEHMALQAQFPLGMFEETAYDEHALSQVLVATRPTPAHEAARAVVAGLIEHFGSKDLAADAVVVCLDWTGRPPA